VLPPAPNPLTEGTRDMGSSTPSILKEYIFVLFRRTGGKNLAKIK
jgi:hypothetical protein